MKKKRWNPICDSGWKKIFFIMRITVFFLFVSLMQVSASVYSQQTKLNLKTEKVSVIEILKMIEEQSDFHFLYRSDYLKGVPDAAVDLKDANLEDVLNKVIVPYGFSYEIDENTVVIKRAVSNTVTQPAMHKKEISGIVKDSKGLPLPGVSVVVKGTTIGTSTDSNGKFRIAVPDTTKALTFSFVGMKTQEITIGAKTIINLTLAEETVGLDEVVAVGYGTMKKSDLTGSVTSLDRSEIGDKQEASIGSILQGKVAGVDVTNGTIRIRGVTTFNSTDPLIVIDGFLGGDLSTLNPDNIESIEVLKDASSTAIYGSRGSNGVILVNTKKGLAGPLKVSVNGFSTISITPKKLNVLNASQYIDFCIDALTNANIAIPAKFQTPAVRQDVTNWQNQVFRVAKTSTVNANFSGGSENSTYFLGLGYIYDEPIVIGSNSSKIFLKVKNDFKIRNWLKAGTNVSLNYSINKGAAPSPPYAMINYPPYLPVYDSKNFWGFSQVSLQNDLSGSVNPIASAMLTHPQTNSFSYEVNSWFELEPLKGLVYRFQAGVTGDYSHFKQWDDSYMSNIGSTIPADYTERLSYDFNPLIESYLTYKHKFGNHDLTVMGGNTWQNFSENGQIGIYGQGYANNTVQNVLVAQNQSVSNDIYGIYAYLSYFGRINYQYNDKYLLTANFRADGSPHFAPSNRWGTFPSVALAWKLHEEKYIKDLNVFDQLKLRASWGISGNDAISNYAYQQQVWNNGVFYPLGTTPVPVQGATVATDADQNIKWESTTSSVVGLDMAFLKNKLSFTADYYVKNTNDILFAVPRSASLGYGLTTSGNAIVNAASCSNKGFEFQAGYKNTIGSFTYSINGNLSFNKNVVTSLGLGQPYLSGVSQTDVGHPIGYFYGWVADGIFKTQAQLDAANQSARAAATAKNPNLSPSDIANIYYQYSTTAPGDVKFKDLNGDGQVTDSDRKMIGNSIPKYLYGVYTNLEYKGFYLNLYFQGIGGNDIYYEAYAITRGMTSIENQESYVLNRWRSESDPGNGIVPRAVIGDPNGNTRTSTLALSDGSYLKLRQLTFGYTLPKNITSKIGLSDAKVYLSAYNLLTFTKYPEFDPEISGPNLTRGYDYLAYPNPRSFSLGVKFGF